MFDPFWTASELARRIRARDISAEEALSLCVARIDRENPRLNAIITLDLERARARAVEADAALSRGETLGPLHGVPFTLKDCHSTAGVRTTIGAPPFRDYVPKEDGTVARRLMAAGAILVGKTNVPPMLMSAQTNNPIFGRTNNPWNLERTVGGSSGGSAAAVAAGLVPFDIGSDMSGSIRMPAHFCGVFGLKPTSNRIPITGHLPPPPGTPRPDRILATVGPLARSVEDLALVTQVLCGPDGLDQEVPPVSWRAEGRREARDLRIAYLPKFPQVPTARCIEERTARVARELEDAGVRVEMREPGFTLEHLNEVWAEFFPLATAIVVDLMGAGLPVAATTSPTASPTDWVRVLDRRDQLVSELERSFDDFDAFLCPAVMTTAFPHSPPRSPIPVDGEEIDSRYVDHYLYPFNLTGHPALVVPAGLDDEGLPIGVQLVGPRWGEERLLRVAETVTEVIGGFRAPPNFGS